LIALEVAYSINLTHQGCDVGFDAGGIGALDAELTVYTNTCPGEGACCWVIYQLAEKMLQARSSAIDLPRSMTALETCVNARRRLCNLVQDHAGLVEPELGVTEREHDFTAFAGELTFDNLAAAAHEAAVQRSEAMSRVERGTDQIFDSQLRQLHAIYWAYLARKQCYVREIDLCVEPISHGLCRESGKAFFF
jgi:hypothetical protein